MEVTPCWSAHYYSDFGQGLFDLLSLSFLVFTKGMMIATSQNSQGIKYVV